MTTGAGTSIGTATLPREAPPTAAASTASLGAAVTAVEFNARPDRHDADAPVVTSRGYVAGALFPSVEGLAAALRALRGAGRTEDVVGLAIPLEGDDPDAGLIRTRNEAAPKRGFDLMDFLMTALDPHRRSSWQATWAPGKNSGTAVELLGGVTRWLVGIQPFAIHEVPGVAPFWVLGRANHAAALHKIAGDSHEGYRGILASFGVVESHALACAERLAAGDLLLTTCESDANRARSDERIMKKAGASLVFERVPLEWRYGVHGA